MTLNPASGHDLLSSRDLDPVDVEPRRGQRRGGYAVDPPPGGLILASASPRRQQLLSEAGYQFQVRPSDIDENFAGHDLSPSDFARTLARAKAWAVLPNYPDSVILAADTIVCLGERILGKPADENDAYRMLSLLAATTHIVITGVAVVRRHPEISNIERVMSAVRMRDLSHAELHRYIAGGQWQGKAGGYGIQDPDPFVVRIAGCQTNIVGLPMTTTRRLLASTGVFPPSQSSPVLS